MRGRIAFLSNILAAISLCFGGITAAEACELQEPQMATDGTTAAPDTTQEDIGIIRLAEWVLDLLTVERQGWKLAVYPAASYSERTGLEIGVMPMLQLRGSGESEATKPTTITPSVLVSTKRMFEVQCDVDIYLPHDISIEGKAEFFRLPDDFYAVGNGRGKKSLAEYDFSRRLLNADILKGLGAEAHWRAGLTLDADYYDFSKIKQTCDSAEAIRQDVPGTLAADRGGNYGAGLIVGYDSRDNVLQPSGGRYVRLRAMGYADVWGSRHRYGLLTIDARRYVALPLESVLAMQIYAAASWGDIPFVKMPAVGGTRLGRAIGHTLKYVDREAWLAQCEWRVPIFWRIGGTAWTACGNVAPKPKQLFDDFHLMGGLGLRFDVFEGKGLRIRLDGGVSNRGDKAVYFNIREAF